MGIAHFVTRKIKPNKRVVAFTVVVMLILFTLGIFMSNIKKGRSDVQKYDQKTVLTIAEQLTDIRDEIDQRFPGLRWMESKRCERYPPASIADEESFACFVAFGSEVEVANQG